MNAIHHFLFSHPTPVKHMLTQFLDEMFVVVEVSDGLKLWRYDLRNIVNS